MKSDQHMLIYQGVGVGVVHSEWEIPLQSNPSWEFPVVYFNFEQDKYFTLSD